jgi:flagellar protein FlaG
MFNLQEVIQMSLDISSLAGRLNAPAHAGPSHRPGKENTRSGLKTDLVKNIDTNENKLNFPEAEVLDEGIYSANHKVDFKINQETHDVVIRVVDSESGEVVKQIPGEDFVQLAQRIAEFNRKFLDETT